MNDNESTIDWEQLGLALGSIREDRSEQSGTSFAHRALEEIIGVDGCRAAVDHYIGHRPGSELARSVLWHIRPWSAMQRCHEVYNSSEDLDERRSAVELLRVVADSRVLPWIPNFLADSDAGVQTWGAGIVDQLLWSNLIEADDCADLLHVMSEHSNEQVRERYEFICSFLESREDSENVEGG